MILELKLTAETQRSQSFLFLEERASKRVCEIRETSSHASTLTRSLIFSLNLILFCISPCPLRLCGEFSQQDYSTISEKMRVENGLVPTRKLRGHHHYLNFVDDNLAVCIGGAVCELDF